MKIRRITRIRHGKTAYRFVNAETGELLRNSIHPYEHAVVGKLDDDQHEVAFSFHLSIANAIKRAQQTSRCIDGTTVVDVEVTQ